jgi:hypothetical protein
LQTTLYLWYARLMSLDFIKEPAVFERAFGPKWGFRVWRGLVVLAVLAAVGGAIFGGLHGYATVRSDFTPRVEVATQPQAISQSQNPKIKMEGFTIDSKGDSLTLNGCFDQEYGDVKLRSREGRGLTDNCKNWPKVAQTSPPINGNCNNVGNYNVNCNTFNIAPTARHLSDAQANDLASALAATHVTGNIAVQTDMMGCTDCDSFANQLQQIIGSVPGWTVKPVRNGLTLVPFKGVALGVKNKDQMPQTAVALETAFGGKVLVLNANTIPEGTDTVIFVAQPIVP